MLAPGWASTLQFCDYGTGPRLRRTRTQGPHAAATTVFGDQGNDMAATRVNFGAILEWVLAAALMVAAVAASALVREFRAVRAVVPVIASEPQFAYDAPADIPPRAVSVPLLLLTNGVELRIGDRAADVAARLGNTVSVVSEVIERSAIRERLTRFYNEPDVQFALVFEALGEDAEPTVAAIYLR